MPYVSTVTKNDSQGAWILGGLAALGLLALASSSQAPVRRTFQEQLREHLANRGCRLVQAQFGRRHGRPVWVVTYELPGGRVQTAHVDVTGAPYADDSASLVFRDLENAVGPLDASAGKA